MMDILGSLWATFVICVCIPAGMPFGFFINTEGLGAVDILNLFGWIGLGLFVFSGVTAAITRRSEALLVFLLPYLLGLAMVSYAVFAARLH